MQHIYQSAMLYRMRGNTAHHPSEQKPKLLDQLRYALCSHHYSQRKEQTFPALYLCTVPRRDGRIRDQCIPDASGGQREGSRLHQESSAFRPVVSLSPHCFWKAATISGRYRNKA